MKYTVEYHSNNSGGDWWLSDEDWIALENAGWHIDWFKDLDDKYFAADKDGRWLGALATTATIETDDIEKSIAEWERITNEYSAEQGCNCCGPPHNFYVTDNSTGEKKYSSIEVIKTERVWI